jgi:hypothetical protein
MERRIDFADYIDRLDRARINRRAAQSVYDSAKRDYEAAFRPLCGEATEESLRAILSICPSDSEYSRSYIHVCLSLLCYAPESLFGGKIPLALGKSIARVLGITHPSVYIARNKVASWLKIYPTFYVLIYKLFDRLGDVLSG